LVDPDGEKYTYCDTNKVCVDYSDDDFHKIIKTFPDGFYRVKGEDGAGNVYQNGELVATYTRPYVDFGSEQASMAINGIVERAPATSRIVNTMGAISAAIVLAPVVADLFANAAANAALRAAAQKLCFVAGTQILTKEGLKPIEEIREGDKVLSYNEKTKQTEYKIVVQTIIRDARAEQLLSVQVEYETEPLGVTNTHPFYVRIYKAGDNTSAEDDGEWVEAGKLEVGNEIRKADNTWAKVQSITQQSKGAKVYNFEVADNHNYFVGQTSLLAHNSPNDCFRVLQRGGHTLRRQTIRALQEAYRQQTGREISREVLKQALEALKRSELGPLANATHETILANGDVITQAGITIGNIFAYIP
jgi:hypothetical protein